MLIYTPTEINTILYSIDTIGELKILVDYLAEYEKFYPRHIDHWIEDIRLMVKTQ